MPETTTSSTITSTTVELSLNLGPNVSMKALGSAVDDLTLVLEFASALQRNANRSATVSARVLSNFRRAENEDPRAARIDVSSSPDAVDWQSIVLDRLYAVYPGQPVRRDDQDGQITVQSLTYNNPLELVILVSGGVVVWVLRLLRDWPGRRQLNIAAASEYQSRAMFRNSVRRVVLRELESGQVPVTPELVEKLLTDDVTDAIGSLGDGPLEIRGLPSGPSASGSNSDD
ncbi:hypothetical protein [Rathayibacter sp. AY1B5]|uniref:hypothetical protein n=1 Tax=Rathayibacter sp. AY1B5 TaxID=2080530 RepID=UPI000CE74D26|nr:hypothetical protein [Rathayibacter sp. AY1B5]PPI26965.1 hypothetical protein C5D44_06390 [Rathayibacter sp. AY1B5]